MVGGGVELLVVVLVEDEVVLVEEQGEGSKSWLSPIDTPVFL